MFKILNFIDRLETVQSAEETFALRRFEDISSHSVYSPRVITSAIDRMVEAAQETIAGCLTTCSRVGSKMRRGFTNPCDGQVLQCLRLYLAPNFLCSKPGLWHPTNLLPNP
eukprot:930930-Amphidinium_carterae.1